MSDFYLKSRIGKAFQKINFQDFEEAYHKIEDNSCPDYRKEVQGICLYNMFLTSRNRNAAIKQLGTHVENYGDSAFYGLMENRFGFQSSSQAGKGIKNAFVDIHQQEHSFEDLVKESQGKVLLIDFWASWCAPCRKSMPAVKKLEEKYGDQNLRVVYVSIDKFPNPWKRASKDEGIYERNNYWASNFQESALYETYSITHIPRYFIYDKSGKLAYEHAPKPEAMEDIIIDLIGK